MEFSRPEYWSGQPFLSLGAIPNPGIKPRFPSLQADSSPQGKLKKFITEKQQKNMKGTSKEIGYMKENIKSKAWIQRTQQ